MISIDPAPCSRSGCRHEIDHALAPSCALHTKYPPALVHKLVDGFPLALAEIDGGVGNAEPGGISGLCGHFLFSRFLPDGGK